MLWDNSPGLYRLLQKDMGIHPIGCLSDLLTMRHRLKYPTTVWKVLYTYQCSTQQIHADTMIKQCTHSSRLAFQSRLRHIWEQLLSFFLPARRSRDTNAPSGNSTQESPGDEKVSGVTTQTPSWDYTRHISLDAEASVNYSTTLQEVSQLNWLNQCSAGTWGVILLSV